MGKVKRVRDFEAAVTDEERHRRTFAVNKDTKTSSTIPTLAPYTLILGMFFGMFKIKTAR